MGVPTGESGWGFLTPADFVFLLSHAGQIGCREFMRCFFLLLVKLALCVL